MAYTKKKTKAKEITILSFIEWLDYLKTFNIHNEDTFQRYLKIKGEENINYFLIAS